MKVILHAMTLAGACLLLALCACHTRFHLMYTPNIEKDFYLPAEEMSERFFDIERYKEMTFPFFAFFEMPPLTEFKYGNHFGPPNINVLSNWNLIPFFMVPPLCPCREMIWDRGNYRFELVVAYPAIFLYGPHIWYWKVREVYPGRPVPPELLLEEPEKLPPSTEEAEEETEMEPEEETPEGLPEESLLPPEESAPPEPAPPVEEAPAVEKIPPVETEEPPLEEISPTETEEAPPDEIPPVETGETPPDPDPDADAGSGSDQGGNR